MPTSIVSRENADPAAAFCSDSPQPPAVIAKPTANTAAAHARDLIPHTMTSSFQTEHICNRDNSLPNPNTSVHGINRLSPPAAAA
jgi:hypothetical protein